MDDIGEKNDEIDRVEIMDCTLLIEEEQETFDLFENAVHSAQVSGLVNNNELVVSCLVFVFIFSHLHIYKNRLKE